MQAGYIKNIELTFYYSLTTPLARRLYRLLDKRLHHQNQLEMDIFDLSARLGQTRYAKPSQVYRKLQPGIQQLVDQKFLADACLVKHGKYTRVRFTKAGAGERTARGQKQAAIQNEFAQVLKAYRTDADTQKVWRTVLRTLKSQLSDSQYAMVRESILLKLQDNRAEVCLASPFAVQWLHRHAQIRDQIVELLQTKARITDLEVVWVDRKTLFENLEKCS